MTANPAINEKKYARLLARTLPAVIQTEAENERMLAQVEQLMDKTNLTPEEDALLKLMVLLIEEFEDKHYRLNAATPLSILKQLMDGRGLKPKDLAEVFGSKGYVSDVLSGKREISKVMARKLAERFNVSVELFI